MQLVQVHFRLWRPEQRRIPCTFANSACPWQAGCFVELRHHARVRFLSPPLQISSLSRRTVFLSLLSLAELPQHLHYWRIINSVSSPLEQKMHIINIHSCSLGWKRFQSFVNSRSRHHPWRNQSGNEVAVLWTETYLNTDPWTFLACRASILALKLASLRVAPLSLSLSLSAALVVGVWERFSTRVHISQASWGKVFSPATHFPFSVSLCNSPT